MKKIRRIVMPCLFLLSVSIQLMGQELIINEVSFGAAGNAQSYVEILVVGPNKMQDIRGYIIDDNNGDINLNAGNNFDDGINSGHVQFSPADDTWAEVPAGSLIVIYNHNQRNAALPTDDPTDANNDLVYILPAKHSSIGYNGENPSTGSDSYSVQSYSYDNINAWTAIQPSSETGDAMQIRNPDGTYHHSVSFGERTTGITADGLNRVHIETSVEDIDRSSFIFSGVHPYSSQHYSRVGASEQTPGAPNNEANTAYIESILSVLPVEWLSVEVTREDGGALIAWSTASELNNSHFEIERSSTEGQNWETIASVPGKGTTSHISRYQYLDLFPTSEGIVYYRVKQVDFDANYSYSAMIRIDLRSLFSSEFTLFPNPVSEKVFLRTHAMEHIRFLTLDGRDVTQKIQFRKVNEGLFEVSVGDLPSGLYLIKGSSTELVMIRE